MKDSLKDIFNESDKKYLALLNKKRNKDCFPILTEKIKIKKKNKRRGQPHFKIYY